LEGRCEILRNGWRCVGALWCLRSVPVCVCVCVRVLICGASACVHPPVCIRVFVLCQCDVIVVARDTCMRMTRTCGPSLRFSIPRLSRACTSASSLTSSFSPTRGRGHAARVHGAARDGGRPMVVVMARAKVMRCMVVFGVCC